MRVCALWPKEGASSQGAKIGFSVTSTHLRGGKNTGLSEALGGCKGRGAFDSWELDWELGLGIPRSWPRPQSQAVVLSASDVTRQKLSFLNFNHVHAKLMFFALRKTYTLIYLKLFLK